MRQQKQTATAETRRAAWAPWIRDQIEKGARKDEAETTADLMVLCKIFGVGPDAFGIVHLPGDKWRVTYKTDRVLTTLLVSLLHDKIVKGLPEDQAAEES